MRRLGSNGKSQQYVLSFLEGKGTVVPLHFMKAYGSVEIQLHSFLIIELGVVKG